VSLSIHTERRGGGLALLLYICDVSGSHFGPEIGILTDVFVDFSHSLQESADVVP
jgi:hypothetical protein